MMISTRVRKSWYLCGSASVSCRISLFESLRCVGAGPAVVLSVTFADGEAGTTAVPAVAEGAVPGAAAVVPDGPSTVSGLAAASPTVGNRSASFSMPSTLTFGGSEIPASTGPSPLMRMFWTMRTIAQAASHVCGTALRGQNVSLDGVPGVPGWRHASAIVLRQELGSRSSLSGNIGNQSFQGPELVLGR